MLAYLCFSNSIFLNISFLNLNTKDILIENGIDPLFFINTNSLRM